MKNRFSVLQATESWAGPGDESNSEVYLHLVMGEWLSLLLSTQGAITKAYSFTEVSCFGVVMHGIHAHNVIK